MCAQKGCIPCIRIAQEHKMDERRDLPSYEDGYLAQFVGDLRAGVFNHQTDAARHFHLHHTTIGHYENVEDARLRPPLGYLACLAVMFNNKPKEDPANAQDVREHLLKEINKAIRAEYHRDAMPFKSWKGLALAAEAYVQERQNARVPAAEGKSEGQAQLLPALLQRMLFVSFDGLEAVMRAETTNGPVPSWPRIFVALLRRALSSWSIVRTAKLALWIWVWFLTWALMAPSLRWPFTTSQQALTALGIYAGGSLILPLLIGVLTDTKNNEFWRQNQLSETGMIRLYTHQGASIGFLLGYFSIFLLGLVGYYVHLRPTTWFELILAVIPLVTGYAGARLVPYNLWRAYGRLSLADGAIFFVFPLLGPAWGLFLFWSHEYLSSPLLGSTIILSAITISVLLMARQYKRTGTTLIPISLWVILYGSMLVLYEIGRGSSLYGIVSLAGLIITFAVLLGIDRIRLTLRGALGLLAAAGILFVSLRYSVWAGVLFACLMVLAWLRWGRGYVSLPISFWGVLLADISAGWGLREGWWPQGWASSIYGVIVLVILWFEYRQRHAR
jgi:hypothetical protein